MKTKNEIIADLYVCPLLDEIISNITRNSDLQEDLKQELFLILMEMDDARIIDAYENKYLKYLYINILTRQFNSDRSPFYKMYKAPHIAPRETSGDDNSHIDQERLAAIENILNTKVDIVDRELFKMYYKMDKYDRWVGELRDKTCQKPISSTRKIERKLALDGGLNNTKKVTIDHSTVACSINKTKKLIQTHLNGHTNPNL